MKPIHLLLLLTTAAAAQSPSDSIRTARAISNQAWAVGDLPAYTATLTSDFVITSGNGGFNTRETFLPVLTKIFADPNAQRCIRTTDQVDLSATRPLAAEHGHWQCRSHMPDGDLLATGTYLAMWRLEGTHWLTRSELFVTLDCHGSQSCKPTQN